jgi:hypothetical protein
VENKNVNVAAGLKLKFLLGFIETTHELLHIGVALKHGDGAKF